MSAPLAARIPLQAERGTWVLYLVGLGFVAVLGLVFGIGIFFAAGFGTGERLVLGPIMTAVGFLALLGVRLCLRMVRVRPRLTVQADAFTVEHTGLFRAPLVVPRDAVAEICIAEFQAHGGRPQRGQRLPSKPPAGTEIVASSELLPDLSFPLGSSLVNPNVLVVMHDHLRLGALPRRGMFGAILLVDRSGNYTGPPRGGVVNGFLFGAFDTEQVRRAFAPWGVLVDEPSDWARQRFSVGHHRDRFKRRT